MERIELDERINESGKGNGVKIGFWIVIGVICLAVVLVKAGIINIPGQKTGSEKGAVVNRVSTKFAVERVLSVEQLWTLKHEHQGVVSVSETNKKGKVKEHYSVKYSGSAVGGVNIGGSTISVDESSKIITVTLPEAYVVDIHVDFGSMQFMWNKNKYNTETVSAEAYKACVKDLKEIVARDTSLLESAKRNAIEQVENLMKSFKKEYSVIVQ